jgi:hypothetical protein
MDRGLRAPLSPREASTLIQIAAGLPKELLPTNHLERLKNLCLVEDEAGDLKLTDTGRERAASSDIASPGPAHPRPS